MRSSSSNWFVVVYGTFPDIILSFFAKEKVQTTLYDFPLFNAITPLPPSSQSFCCMRLTILHLFPGGLARGILGYGMSGCTDTGNRSSEMGSGHRTSLRPQSRWSAHTYKRINLDPPNYEVCHLMIKKLGSNFESLPTLLPNCGESSHNHISCSSV